MNLLKVVSLAFRIFSMPCGMYQNKRCIPIDHFRFFYRSSSYGHNSIYEEVRVLIVHPNGGDLEIATSTYDSELPGVYSEYYRPGAWDQDYKDALKAIEEANATYNPVSHNPLKRFEELFECKC